jgi:hypothetical protein
MHRWFLSYNSQDLALMQSLEAALRSKDADAKLFFAPKVLRVGGLWLPEVARGIAEATAFVLLVGEKGIGPWQAMEYYEALERRVKQQDFPVVLVLLDGQPAPGLAFLRQLHWVITADPASEKSLVQIMDAVSGNSASPGELWRHTAPYHGLTAMTEPDSDYFFGRGRETVELIRALVTTSDKLPILLGNSGVGKSSLAQAGAIAAFMRQAWPETAEAPGAWPHIFNGSRRWCFLKLKPGAEPVRALVEPFFWTWQFEATDPKRATIQSSWVDELLAGKVKLRDLLDATQARYRDELQQPEPPSFLIYIDQGEELYVRAEERERRRFSEIIADGLSDNRLRAMMSMRSDFFGELQKDESLYDAHYLINVLPMRELQLLEVVSRPAELLSARFESGKLAAYIAHGTAEESAKDAGALPLLSYLLDNMWKQMIWRGDGVLRLPASVFDLGGVLVERADTFIATHRNSEDMLRRIFTLRVATVREGEEPTRRRAPRSEFSDEEWRLVSELADDPNRLLVTATSEANETHAEVAHETIFRRWDKLRDWIAAERAFLAWRNGLENARRSWQASPSDGKKDTLLRGHACEQALNWLASRCEDLVAADRNFIKASAALKKLERIKNISVIGIGCLFIWILTTEGFSLGPRHFWSLTVLICGCAAATLLTSPIVVSITVMPLFIWQVSRLTVGWTHGFIFTDRPFFIGTVVGLLGSLMCMMCTFGAAFLSNYIGESAREHLWLFGALFVAGLLILLSFPQLADSVDLVVMFPASVGFVGTTVWVVKSLRGRLRPGHRRQSQQSHGSDLDGPAAGSKTT